MKKNDQIPPGSSCQGTGSPATGKIRCENHEDGGKIPLRIDYRKDPRKNASATHQEDPVVPPVVIQEDHADSPQE